MAVVPAITCNEDVMSMTGKARATLRAEAHHLDVQVHIGHAGLTPSLLRSFDDVLRTHELVKVQVAKGGELSAKEAANQAAGELGAEVIQVIGRTFTVYRENPELPRGELPPWRR
ncbi:YhbY family RNA-binding protein [Gemmatimonas aurantiaca]|uniref:YhbY family RNA-binding protein n=1 Tax=Gemmatimonas aurantiaca TaxID=173480 RepID=UPI00301BFD24